MPNIITWYTIECKSNRKDGSSLPKGEGNAPSPSSNTI
jgi:hypothetical protein